MKKVSQPETKANTIGYPRRVFLRALMRGSVRFLLKILTDTQVSGIENIPSDGSVILAANHVSMLEAALLAAFPPRQVEFLGASDIPFVGVFAPIVHAYGFIPLNRGNLDRDAIITAQRVLAQGGVIGIFPEGAIWDPARMNAQLGASLLSQRSGAPIIPIGFSGMQGALSAALHFKRPQLLMRIGAPIPPLESRNQEKPAKTELSAHADLVLKHINELLSNEERLRAPVRSEFALSISPANVPGVTSASQFQLPEASVIAHFLFSPVLLDALASNLRLPVRPLYLSKHPIKTTDFQKAIEAVLAYLKVNPAFFTYRMGMQDGTTLAVGLGKLNQILSVASQDKASLRVEIKAISFYPDGHSEIKQGGYLLLPE